MSSIVTSQIAKRITDFSNHSLCQQ